MESIQRRIREFVSRITRRGRGEEGIHPFLSRRRIVGVLLVGVGIVIVITGIWFTSVGALPGTALYSFKTNIVEPWRNTLHRSTGAKLSYQVVLLERRLDETASLAKKDTVSEHALNQLQAAAAANTTELTTLVESNSGSELPASELLETFADASSILETMKTIVQKNDQMQVIEERVEDLQADTESVRNSMTFLYISSVSPDALHEYLATRLSALSKQLEDADPDSDVTAEAVRYAQKMLAAVAKDDAAGAMRAMLDAFQTIEVGDQLRRLKE